MKKYQNLLIVAVVGLAIGALSTFLFLGGFKIAQSTTAQELSDARAPAALVRAVASIKADIEVGLSQHEFDGDLKRLKVEYALATANLAPDEDKATKQLIYRADALSHAWHNDISLACASINNSGRLATGKSFLEWMPSAKKYQAPCIASVSSFLYATGTATPSVEAALSHKDVETGLILKTFISLGLDGVHSSASTLYQSLSGTPKLESLAVDDDHS